MTDSESDDRLGKFTYNKLSDEQIARIAHLIAQSPPQPGEMIIVYDTVPHEQREEK